jgi:hypothetical protein
MNAMTEVPMPLVFSDSAANKVKDLILRKKVILTSNCGFSYRVVVVRASSTDSPSTK